MTKYQTYPIYRDYQMRIHRHPKISGLACPRDSLHLATGKFKPSEWTAKDAKVISRLIAKHGDKGQKPIDALLAELYTKNETT
jgi:hypothetical protein